MTLYNLIKKNNKEQEKLKAKAKKSLVGEKRKLLKKYEALQQKKDIMLEHLELVKELTQMCYNEEIFQKHFYARFLECNDSEFIEKLTNKKYNSIDYNFIILDTKKEYATRLNNEL